VFPVSARATLQAKLDFVAATSTSSPTSTIPTADTIPMTPTLVGAATATVADPPQQVIVGDVGGAPVMANAPAIISPPSAAVLQLQSMMEASGFASLEKYMATSLNSQSKIRLKLENPVGVAERLIEKYAKVLQARRNVLADDVTALAALEADIAAFKVTFTEPHLLMITLLLMLVFIHVCRVKCNVILNSNELELITYCCVCKITPTVS
jgi:hypothetical protein